MDRPTEVDHAAICSHIAKHIGTVAQLSPTVVAKCWSFLPVQTHAAVKLWHATSEDSVVVFTTGVSAAVISVPDVGERRIELMIRLPREWPLTRLEPGPQSEGNQPSPVTVNWDDVWPLVWLLRTASLPLTKHEHLWFGHTIPNGEPAQPFAKSVALCAWMVVPPLLLAEGEDRVIASHGEVMLAGLLALVADELASAREHGPDGLLANLDRHETSDVVGAERTAG